MEPAVTRRRDQLLLTDELALLLVTVAAIVGMHRLFVDGSYRGSLVLQAVAAHLVVAALRRTGVSLLPAALATVAIGVVFLSWTRFPDTTRWLLPTGETLSQAHEDLNDAWQLFGRVKAPAPVENGFVAASGAAIWLLVIVADWAAFRVSATLEALLPATTLFVFAAALGGPGSPVAGAAVFAGSALLFVLLHRTSNQERTARWAGEHRTRGRWSLLGTGAALLGVAVVVGAIAGPRLPGAGAEAVVAWRDINKDEPTRVVLSPMVSLQTKLVEQPEVEVFTVRADQSSYWRVTSLDEFDGDIWRSSYSTDDAKGRLPRAFDTTAPIETVTQDVTIVALNSVWLPAAYEPVAVDTGDQTTDFDERSSTLMVDRDVATSDGYQYTVTSDLPQWTADELRTASNSVPEDIRKTYLQLPQDFSELVETRAYEATRAATTQYDKAVALQDYLRNNFVYDLSVGAGHGNDALATFLFETKRGYCEQFAGAFAAMARSIDLPARVAVGFTPGVQDSHDPTLFRVRGVHAHAWPEVYLGEYGWVPFEPTPGRGPPRGENWLGVPERQDTTGGGAAATDPGAGPSTNDGQGSGTDGLATGDEQRTPDQGLGQETSTTPGAAADDDSGLPQPVRDAAQPVGIAILAYVVFVPLLVVGRRALRRQRAATPSAKVRLSWTNATEYAAFAGVSLPPSLTIAETANRLAAALPGSAAEVQHLARTMEMIAYAEQEPSDADVADARHGWASVSAEARRRVPWGRRVASYLDIRRLRLGRGSRLVAHQGPG
jgi:transglutaminase-like putative cysteine protease